MLLEITSPVRVLRELRVTEAGNGGGVATGCRSCSAIKLLLLRRFGTLRQHGFYARNIAPYQTQAARLFELSALLLQTQMQTFLSQVASLRQQLARAHFDYFLHLHG